MAEVHACSRGRTRRTEYYFLFSLGLVHIFLPTIRSVEPKILCDASNNGVYIRDNNDCAVAYVCSVPDGWLKLTCGKGLWFDLNVNLCNNEFMVQCSKECLSNPCIYNGICSEIPGGYRCSYPNVVTTFPSGKDKILVSQYKTRDIFMFDLFDGSVKPLPISGEGHPNVMKYVSDKLFIAFENPNEIVETDLKNTYKKTLMPNVFCEGMDIDVTTDKIFYSDYRSGTINVMSMTGSGQKTLISRGLRRPRSVVADTKKQMLFWIDITMERIETSTYAGEGRTTLHTTEYPPRALSMISDGRLFWCNKMDEIWEFSQNPPRERLLFKPPGDLKLCDSIVAYHGRIYTVYLLTEKVFERDLAGNLLKVFDGSQHLTHGAYKTVLPFKS